MCINQYAKWRVSKRQSGIRKRGKQNSYVPVHIKCVLHTRSFLLKNHFSSLAVDVCVFYVLLFPFGFLTADHFCAWILINVTLAAVALLQKMNVASVRKSSTIQKYHKTNIHIVNHKKKKKKQMKKKKFQGEKEREKTASTIKLNTFFVFCLKWSFTKMIYAFTRK